MLFKTTQRIIHSHLDYLTVTVLTLIYLYTHAHIHTHIHTHRCTHVHAQAHVHAHAQTRLGDLSCSVSRTACMTWFSETSSSLETRMDPLRAKAAESKTRSASSSGRCQVGRQSFRPDCWLGPNPRSQRSAQRSSGSALSSGMWLQDRSDTSGRSSRAGSQCLVLGMLLEGRAGRCPVSTPFSPMHTPVTPDVQPEPERPDLSTLLTFLKLSLGDTSGHMLRLRRK